MFVPALQSNNPRMPNYSSVKLVAACIVGAIGAAVALEACSRRARPTPVPSSLRPNSVGANPRLPAPDKRLIPVVQVAAATGWPAGDKPTGAANVEVNAFAKRPRASALDPRAAERRCARRRDQCAAERPEHGKGIKGKVMKSMQAKAGAATPSANRITLLRDADGDGSRRSEDGIPRSDSTRRSAWRSSATICTSRTPMRS